MSQAGSQPMPKPMPPQPGELVCRECGARNEAGSRDCWLCNGRSLAAAGAEMGPPIGASAWPPRPRGFFSTIAGWMVVIAILAVCLGLYAVAPGLLFLAAITVLPAIAIVEVKAARRRRQGLPMSGFERVCIFVLLTFLVPVFVAGAVVFALFIFCAVSGTPSFH